MISLMVWCFNFFSWF